MVLSGGRNLRHLNASLPDQVGWGFNHFQVLVDEGSLIDEDRCTWSSTISASIRLEAHRLMFLRVHPHALLTTARRYLPVKACLMEDGSGSSLRRSEPTCYQYIRRHVARLSTKALGRPLVLIERWGSVARRPREYRAWPPRLLLAHQASFGSIRPNRHVGDRVRARDLIWFD